MRGCRVLLLALAGLVAAGRAEAGGVDVTVSGVRSSAGMVLVAICDRATFLQESCPYRGRVTAAAGSVVVRVTGIPPGVYAAQAFQDENGNGQVDRTLLGIPKEGIGFSNDAQIRFGPPSFDEAAFSITAGGGAIQFQLRYFD